MNKPDRYLPMRESEFVALLSMVDEINKQIKKTKKIARKERQHLDDESDNNFTQVPLPPIQKKGQTNVLYPAVILMILRVVVKKLIPEMLYVNEFPVCWFVLGCIYWFCKSSLIPGMLYSWTWS